MKDKKKLTGRERGGRKKDVGVNREGKSAFELFQVESLHLWIESLQSVLNTLDSSGQACREGPSPSLGTESVDAQRHSVSFTTASSRQGPRINHVQRDSPSPPPWILAWKESVTERLLSLEQLSTPVLLEWGSNVCVCPNAKDQGQKHM